MIRIFYLLLILGLLQSGCRNGNSPEAPDKKLAPVSEKNLIEKSPDPVNLKAELTGMDSLLMESGLINIHTLDPTIKVDLKYSTTDNFLKTDLYGNLENCYLLPGAAEKLAKAQRQLKELHPGYSLVIFDGARPLSVQRKMWNALKVPEGQRWKYVSNPDSGSLHNFGAAVDVSILDERGELLDMGTPYDFFGEEAEPALEEKMVLEKRLTTLHVENRRLLRTVMKKAGFRVLPSEWWHFNYCSREEARKKYKIIE